MPAGISAVKTVTHEAVRTATNCTLQSFDFGKSIILVLVFPFFLVVEGTIKSQIHFAFWFWF
jgi:hypothetical protein